ncbi:hypothetical protein HDV63DRAFT_404388 [Trichoderma sp. SZMC 28014]
MGQFDWFKKIGATDEAVAVLNDQPYLFTVLLVVIVTLLVQGGVLYAIHWGTFKDSQKKQPKKGAKSGGGGLIGKLTGGIVTAKEKATSTSYQKSMPPYSTS